MECFHLSALMSVHLIKPIAGKDAPKELLPYANFL